MPPAVEYIPKQECRNRKFKALVLGWLGIILSGVMKGCSTIMVYLQPHIEKWLRTDLLVALNKKKQQHLSNLLTNLSHTVYGLSLLNTGVSVLLLIGVAMNISGFLYPWLLFNGTLLGLSCLLAVLSIKAALYMDLLSFLIAIFVFMLIIKTFYKIYHAVYIVVKVIKQQKRHNRG